MPSRIESVDEAAVTAESFGKKHGIDDSVLSAIDMAIRESVANAVKHGNKFDESKDVDIIFVREEEFVEISVRDYGSGFVVEEVPDPTDPLNLLNASGRGILFMRSFMDEVEWITHDNNGTTVRMLKRF